MAGPHATAERLITAEELLANPDWEHCELVDGKVVQMSPAGGQHGDISGLILGEIYVWNRTRKLGRVFAAETGFLISRNPDTVRGPDAMYISYARLPDSGRIEGYIPCAPDLAVEVVSPTDTFSKVTEKAQSYVTAGVRLAWVVDPQTRRAYVFKKGKPVENLTEENSLSGEDVLPGFELPLKEVFR